MENTFQEVYDKRYAIEQISRIFYQKEPEIKRSYIDLAIETGYWAFDMEEMDKHIIPSLKEDLGLLNEIGTELIKEISIAYLCFGNFEFDQSKSYILITPDTAQGKDRYLF